MQEAEAALQESLQTYRQLAKENPAAYRKDVGGTLNTLAVLHSAVGKLNEAESEIAEAVNVNRERWKTRH